MHVVGIVLLALLAIAVGGGIVLGVLWVMANMMSDVD